MSMKISNDTMRSRACGFPAFSAVCPHTHIYIKVNFGHIENSVQGNKEIVNSGLLWCDAVLLGEIFLFQRNVRKHQLAQCHIPEDLNAQSHNCENCTSHIISFMFGIYESTKS